MAVLEAGSTIEKTRRALQDIGAPYLLRKYDATIEDYEQLVDEDLRCEYLNGVLVVHSPATFAHENVSTFLAALLRFFAEQRNLGWVLGGNVVMRLGERRFCPDLSFLHAAHSDRIQKGQVAGPLDLVIELFSTSTRDYDLREKRAAYREGNVPEIWLVDPERQEFHVDVLAASPGVPPGSPTLYQTETLRQGRWESRVLDGFWVDVTWLWSEPLPNVLDCFRAVVGAR
jgi:Uma2 family endonuclease